MIYMLLSILAGAVLPLQALINARLALGIGNSLWAAAISFQVGALGLLLLQLALRAPWSELGRAGAIPAWIWTGGFLGAVYVASVIASVPRLGAASVISLVIFGQLMASLLLDHFGVLAPVSHPINFTRLIGAVLLLAGAILIERT
jgi:bacterial/archaeal transporter family-2 protein